ncbi:intraflagellar transport protein 46 homolog isoform X2 [Liolophura sinensis]|uniref:intraflagellar transport protein 46 homolog isoform X2 n=1 Tax=Liolophura sinensis TaxID=3198878 RepID=UPI0031590191
MAEDKRPLVSAEVYQNQPYDESLEVPDAEEVASSYTPTPRGPPHQGHPSRGNTPPDAKMSEPSDDEFEITKGNDKEPVEAKPRPTPSMNPPGYSEEEEDEDDSSEEEDDDEDDDQAAPLEGAYDPAEYENLPVTPEIKELFQYITRYTPQSIELEHKLKPFIPDFIPTVGDIDAFIKIPRPDGKPDSLGLTVLDEPCAKQSDPTVLDLQLRAMSKQTTSKQLVVKSLEDAEKQPKAIENWIENIRELHRSKPPPNVHYSKNMPDIDNLMQEWPPEFEELLKEVGLPTADLDCDLGQYVDMICAILDIPIHKATAQHNEKIQALHVLFTLYSEFKNSQHFRALAAENKLSNSLKRTNLDSDIPDSLMM